MGIFDALFGKKAHDPAQAMIAWLEKQPPIARMTVAGWLGPENNAGIVLDWILSRPDCDRMTALDKFWRAMQNAPAEVAARRIDPMAPAPNLALVTKIATDWTSDRYTDPEYGFETALYWGEFTKKLRKHRLKAADFDLPDGIRDPISGPRFSNWHPSDERLRMEMDRLIGDITVCDLAIKLPDIWLPVRKKRLGY